MSDYSLENITQDWIESGWRHLKAVSADLTWDYWNRENFLQDLPRKWKLSFRAEHEGRIVGYIVASLKGEWVWLHHLIISSERRGQGLGSAMLKELEGRAAAIDAKGVRMKVRKNDTKAIKFYCRHGYQSCGEDGEYCHYQRLRPQKQKIVAIHQPNYIPWAGYFQKMMKSDDFIFLDDAQITKNSFINRNRIKQQRGELWLTIPVNQTLTSKIKEIRFADSRWQIKHLKSLRQFYSKAPFFAKYFPQLEDVLLTPSTGVADMNIRLIKRIAEWLEISCVTHRSSVLGANGTSDDRLVDLVQTVCGQIYLSGGGGANYQSEEKFRRAGIKLVYNTFKPPVYPQVGGDFVPGLSVLDLIFNCGPTARDLLDAPEETAEALE